MPYGSILSFFVLQVSAGLVFKYGALHKPYWWHSFVIGNVLGMVSIYFLMRVYHDLNPNLGEAICRGGRFVLLQLAFVAVYHSRLGPVQWCGVAMIVAGIFIVSLCHC
jgi:multidrug transporter EmrE-like cation transporter